MTVKDVYDYLNIIAPFDTAEEWDNCGLLIGSYKKEVKRIYIALDVTGAVLDDAITLKRFFQESCRVRLEPENSAYKPIYCQDVHVAGVLAGIIRTY